jgi:hypothetical protein
MEADKLSSGSLIAPVTNRMPFRVLEVQGDRLTGAWQWGQIEVVPFTDLRHYEPIRAETAASPYWAHKQSGVIFKHYGPAPIAHKHGEDPAYFTRLPHPRWRKPQAVLILRPDLLAQYELWWSKETYWLPPGEDAPAACERVVHLAAQRALRAAREQGFRG